MRCAANFAFANRQILANAARQAFEAVLAGKIKTWHLHQIYDITHNMGKIETHEIDGEPMKVCVHRKGATRAFGPGSPELPEEYRAIGQPVLVPGSMGTASWVLAGTAESMQRSFGSSCHGAGRVMSRHQAKREVRGETLRHELESQASRRADHRPVARSAARNKNVSMRWSNGWVRVRHQRGWSRPAGGGNRADEPDHFK
jgi:tRNA-splicing ligase RtcB